MEEINTEWISEFETTDKKYESFYKDAVADINIFFMYVDRDCNLFYIKKEKTNLCEGTLKKDSLVQLLKNNMMYNNKKYRPISLLKYNITIDPENINKLIETPTSYNYLKSQDSIQDLKWDNSIKTLSNLNSLHIIFFETWKDKAKNSTTKKVFIQRKLTKNKKTKKQRKKTTKT
tara:strand:+ start:800 stop:1324 length:525 start_codon:yes stop_codon:yes gene_type:complete